ncbi:hypothetical protein D3C71_1568710 [compost metagenome]
MAQMMEVRKVIHLANMISFTSTPKFSKDALLSWFFETITGSVQALLMPRTMLFQ